MLVDMELQMNNPSPVVLVPGWWLGSWAWDKVTEHLSRDGIQTVAVTLPGLDSSAAPRAGISLADHVDALIETISSTGGPVVLVAHSGAGALATAVLDRVPSAVGRVVYIDSGPVAAGAIARPDLDTGTIEIPLPPLAQLRAGGVSLDGLSKQALQRFRDRAVPHPAGPLREPVQLSDPARNQIPATIVCCSFPSATVREMAATRTGMFAPLADLTDIHYIDLPTGHWPMWSEPDTLAEIIEAIAHG